jgi:hypothetical protein
VRRPDVATPEKPTTTTTPAPEPAAEQTEIDPGAGPFTADAEGRVTGAQPADDDGDEEGDEGP